MSTLGLSTIAAGQGLAMDTGAARPGRGFRAMTFLPRSFRAQNLLVHVFLKLRLGMLTCVRDVRTPAVTESQKHPPQNTVSLT